MFKRLLALSAACLMLLSAAACGGADKPETSSNPASGSAMSTDSLSGESGSETGLTDTSQTEETGETEGANASGGKNTTTPKGDSTKTTKKTSTGGKSIVWWTENPGSGATKHLNNALIEFEKKSGITVEIFIQQPSGGTLTAFDDKFIPAMAAGNGPDVTSFNYVNPEYAVDITSKLNADFWNQFFPSVRDSLKLDGKYYSTPTFMSVNGLLLYSKVDFKNAGLDPNSPPTTIKQLDEMAAKLYKPNKAGDGYDQVGFYPWFWLMLEYPNLLTKPFGGDWTNADGYPTANSAEVIAALEWMMGYVKKYGFDKVNNSLSKLVNENNMYGHALAMNMSFSAQLNAMAKGKMDSKEWGIAPFPGKDANHNGLSIGLAAGYSVVKGSKKVDESVEFMKFMSTDYQKNYVTKNYQNYDTYSCNKSAWEANKGQLDGFTKMMYEDVLSSARASDIGSRLRQGKYTTPATYMTLVKNSIDKILKGEVEIRAEMDALQKKIAAQTKKN